MDNKDILKKAGLSDPQAEVYNCLLINGAMTPAELGKNTNQSRENCYAIIKKLVDLGLAEQTKDKKTTYRVLNPSNLEILVEKRRKAIAKNEKIVKDNLSSLLDIFYANNELPGARTLEGLDGIKEVYLDNLRAKKDVYFLRTRADRVLGHDDIESFMRQYRNQRPLLGIHAYGLTPVDKYAVKNATTGRDDAIMLHRTWMPDADYTAPVEIQAYGDKVALISFSKDTQMATIITSPVIAEAVRQILKIMMNLYQKTFPQNQK
ncbi:hypothetical protein IKG28_03355 [Candidatus Saccharibacteria bacterium]|nr:hypothetical protein [Candidatus Saccharibacteria bacterium]